MIRIFLARQVGAVRCTRVGSVRCRRRSRRWPRSALRSWWHRVPCGRIRIMTQLPLSAPDGGSMWRLVVGLLIRVTVSATVLLAVYYLVPTKSGGDDSDLPWLILDLVIFGLVVAVQVPVIVRAKYPRL